MSDVTAHDVLLSYSEWLDTESLMASPDDPETGELVDKRTHSDLVSEFVASIEGTPLGEACRPARGSQPWSVG